MEASIEVKLMDIDKVKAILKQALDVLENPPKQYDCGVDMRAISWATGALQERMECFDQRLTELEEWSLRKRDWLSKRIVNLENKKA